MDGAAPVTSVLHSIAKSKTHHNQSAVGMESQDKKKRQKMGKSNEAEAGRQAVGMPQSNESGSGDKGPLASMFSDVAREKFARAIKPEEFKLKSVKAPEEYFDEEEKEEEKLKLEKKMAKKAKRKERVDKASEHATATASVDMESGRGKDVDEKKDGSITRDKLTVFVGNVPTTETVTSITKLFKEFGEVESVRLRSVPIAGTKVDDAGNQNLVKKVCTNNKLFGTQKECFNAYVVFKNEESVNLSLAANNRVVGARHIRVDRVYNPILFDPKCSVFIGNLPHYADEEALREHFAKVLVNGQDDIKGVRIVRDQETLLCKGFGYLLLGDHDCVLKVLGLNQEKFKKRELRITICAKRTKRVGNQFKNNGSITPSSKPTAPGKPKDKKRHRDRDSNEVTGDSKRQRTASDDAKNALAAQKRISLKGILTKKQVLVNNKQKKAQKGRKGKKLGGVIKRALKAQDDARSSK